LLGETEAVAGTDEIAWAFRKLLEDQAPLVVCFDDIQWGEETFLDLVESTALLSTGVPLLLLCMARPELLDRRATWSATFRLEPLPEEDAEALVGDAVPKEMRREIVRASGGNPLFLTEMVALSHQSAGEVEVPPTLRALLAARLDQLDERERRALECGAVEGELFHRGTVQALALEETEVTPRLAALVRRGLVRPERPMLPREDAYRFCHLLIRDAAYDALPKATRTDLHRRFAAWLEAHGESLVELDEVLGYHLEQAARYLDELGRQDSGVALAAGDRLGAAGRRAYWRGDWRAAISLLERALSLTRPYRFDLHRELELVQALLWTDVERAVALAEAAAERAEAAGDDTAAALARTVGAATGMGSGGSSPDEVERLARAVLPRLEAEGDDEGLAHVWYALSGVANMRGCFEDGTQAMVAALRHARRAGQPVLGFFTAWLGVHLVWGPRPASEALATFDSVLGESPYPPALVARALLLAMLGRIDEAWAVTLPAQERSRELGFPAWAVSAEIALVAGDYEAAAAYWRDTCEVQEASGDLPGLSSSASALARILCLLGRHDEAESLAQRGRELADPGDISAQAAWRQAEALVRSARGEHAEAERLAREAVDFLLRGDSPFAQGSVLCNLAQVLEAAGRRDDAVAAWRRALDCYERKEVIPLTRRVRERLAELEAAPA
jgi:tetratricopeptide (TPR) repeat protein